MILTIPTDEYVEEIRAYRQEFLDAGDSMDDAGPLRRCRGYTPTSAKTVHRTVFFRSALRFSLLFDPRFIKKAAEPTVQLLFLVPVAGVEPAPCRQDWILSFYIHSEMGGLVRHSRAVDGHAENRCTTRLHGKNREKCLQRLPLRTMAEKTRFSANRRAFGGRSKGDFTTNRLF